MIQKKFFLNRFQNHKQMISFKINALYLKLKTFKI